MPYGETPLVKGSLFVVDRDAVQNRIPFQYNPTQIRRVMGVDWMLSKAAGQFQPSSSFVGFNPQEITFQIMLFGREQHVQGSHANADVGARLAQLELLVSPGSAFTVERPAFVAPPRIILVLGNRAWHVELQTLKVSETMFDRKLNPVMARVDFAMVVVSRGLLSEVRYKDRLVGRL